MSDKSYALLADSTEKVETLVPAKESPSTNSEPLHRRYVQIALAVALYW